MDPVIYNNDFLHGHSLWSIYGCSLNDDISNRDYPGTNYFNPQIDALDMDRYEKTICAGQADSTTDAVIGIMTCNNKQLCNPRMQLIELRMKYQSADTLSKSSMERKVTHTKQLLGPEKPINVISLFVFNDHVAPQARHKVESWKHEGGEIRNFVVLSTSEFNDNIKSFDDMPYEPINKRETVIGELWKFIDDGNWERLFDKIHFWIDYANKTRYTNSFEFSHIQQIIVTEWAIIRDTFLEFPDEDMEIDAMIIDEDIETIK